MQCDKSLISMKLSYFSLWSSSWGAEKNKNCISLHFLLSQPQFSESCITVLPCLLIKYMTVERLERYRSQWSHNYFPQLRLWVLSHYFVMYSSPSQFLPSAAFSKVIVGIPSKNDSPPWFQFIISISTLLLINKCVNMCTCMSINTWERMAPEQLLAFTNRHVFLGWSIPTTLRKNFH